MRAAFYECDITPPLGGYIEGYYSKRIAQDVYDKLYAKAVVFEDNGEVAAIVAVDVCELPVGTDEIVSKRINEYTEIPFDRICIAANHTHLGAPVLDSPEINCFKDPAYTDVFFRLCADAAILAYKRLDDVEVKYTCSTFEEDIAFNRNYELKDGTYITNVRGDKIKRSLGGIDTDLPVITVEKDGKLLGVVYSYALHQDTVMAKIPGYSGDYSSIVSKKLKEKYGSDFVSVFLAGACGDINHINPDADVPIVNYEYIGNKLAKAVINAIKDTKPIGSGINAIKEEVNLERRVISIEEATKLAPTLPKFGRIRNLIYYVSTLEEKFSTHKIQGLLIGDIFIAVFPGEFYAEFGKRIKANSPFEKTMVIETIDYDCGYIPTKDLITKKDKNQLYETSLCYGSCHVPETGDMVTEKIINIANRLNKFKE